jgi:hypothetical protein
VRAEEFFEDSQMNKGKLGNKRHFRSLRWQMQRNAIRLAIAGIILALSACFVSAQETGGGTPIVSGAVGFLTMRDNGQTSLQPVITPVVLVPLGSRLLVESSFQFQGFIARSSTNGPYEGQLFTGVQYLQLDYVANSHLTVVAGYFTTPFNRSGERIGPLWIHNLADGPLI